MNLFHALVFGIVQGISEFLPISSTGHLILTARILGLEQSEFIKSFEISIQLGSILAVIMLYWKSLFKDLEALKRVFLAFIPTGILGLLLYKIVKKFLLGSHEIVLGSLIVGGVIMIVFECLHKENNKKDSINTLSYKRVLFIGLFQSLAMIPGVSRSAATIIGGLSLGISRKTIVEFSFILAVPTLLAATGLDLVKNVSNFSSDQFLFLSVGFVTSFIMALFAIRFLLAFIKKHSFMYFGVYRILIALLFWFY